MDIKLIPNLPTGNPHIHRDVIISHPLCTTQMQFSEKMRLIPTITNIFCYSKSERYPHSVGNQPDSSFGHICNISCLLVEIRNSIIFWHQLLLVVQRKGCGVGGWAPGELVTNLYQFPWVALHLPPPLPQQLKLIFLRKICGFYGRNH